MFGFGSGSVPVVSQMTATECGLCVGVALLRFYGRAEEIYDARTELDPGRDGTSLSDLARFLESRGLQTKSFRFKDIQVLSQFNAPLVLHWANSHYVVLDSFDGERARVMDPGVGRRWVDLEELVEKTSETRAVLWASPTEEFEPSKGKLFAEWRGRRLVDRQDRLRIVGLTVLMIVSYLGVLGVPYFTGRTVDDQDMVANNPGVVALLIVCAAFLYFALVSYRAKALAVLLESLGGKMTYDVFNRMLRLPYRFFSLREPGELLFRLGSVNTIREIVAARVAQGVLDVGALVGLGIYLFIVDPWIALLAYTLVAVSFVVAIKTRTRVLELTENEISSVSESHTVQLDAIVSMSSIRLGGYEQDFVNRWDRIYKRGLQASRKRMILQDGYVGGFTASIGLFGPILILFVGLLGLQSGRVTLGNVFTAQMLAASFLGLAASITQAYTQFLEASKYMTRINEIYLMEPERKSGHLEAMPTAAVELFDVSFKYSAHAPVVLSDINLRVEQGQRAAIVGVSGSGKSTLGKLIATLYQPSSGWVMFGNHSVGEYDLTKLRSQIGYVPQENHMHNRSILDNLTLGRPIPMERIYEICRAVGLEENIAELPMGLNTMVMEMGANFSGGQRQRYALARTLLQNPKILVMDEATSSLDALNEQRVVDYLKHSNTTQIIIAHRLSTIVNADTIHVMDRGRIIEKGNHQTLINTNGYYAKLYKTSSNTAALM